MSEDTKAEANRDEAIRLQCISLAAQTSTAGTPPATVVFRAKEYADFVKGITAGVVLRNVAANGD